MRVSGCKVLANSVVDKRFLSLDKTSVVIGTKRENFRLLLNCGEKGVQYLHLFGS